ncbi:MAG: hypothetical protein AAGB26_09365 [Planctomycetota bacterium]
MNYSIFAIIAGVVFCAGCSQTPIENSPASSDSSYYQFGSAMHMHSRHGCVLIARTDGTNFSYSLITAENILHLGVLRNPDKPVVQRVSDERSLVRIRYQSGYGTGISQHREIAILLREHDSPLMASIYAGGYVSGDWHIDHSTADRFAALDSVEMQGTQVIAMYTYGFEEQEPVQHVETIALQPHPTAFVDSRVVMEFMGYSFAEQE